MKPQSHHPFQVADLVIPAIPSDERLWVPQTANIWFRPLLFNTSQGYWINLLRVKKTGVLNRHLHPAPVFGLVLRGSWRYLEHDWTAHEGDFVYEPPGEVHTLMVEEGVDEMITLFQVHGTLIYMDETRKPIGYDDVHTKLRADWPGRRIRESIHTMRFTSKFLPRSARRTPNAHGDSSGSGCAPIPVLLGQ